MQVVLAGAITGAMWRILRYLVGPDAFISYARADAGAYADRLNDRLKSEKGISVYLDQERSPVGAELPASLRWELRLSRRLVVIVSDAATASENVRLEVEEFSRHPRPVIPIDCLVESPRPAWPGLTGAYWRDESAEKRAASTPSDEIVGEIVGAIGADRQSNRTRRAAWRTAAFVLAAAVGSSVMVGFARFEAEKARTSESIATLSAQRQKRLASAAEKARDRASEQALRQQQIAEAMATVNAADALITSDPRRREQALLMNMVALRRLQDLQGDPHAAAAALRARLEQTGRVRKTFAWDSKVEGAVISREGRFVAGVTGNSIRLIDVASGHRRFLRMPKKATSIRVPRFSDDGTRLGAIVDDKTLVIWRIADGSVAATFKAPVTYFRDFVLSPRGDAYAAVESLGDEPAAGENLYVRPSAGSTPELMLHRDAFDEIAFSPDANLLGVCAEAGGVWRLRSGKEEATQLMLLPRCGGVLFSDGGTIAVSIGNGVAKAHAVPETPSIDDDPPSLWESNCWTAASDGASIAIGRHDAIEVRELVTGRIVSHLPFAHASAVAMKGEFVAALSDGGATSAIYRLDGTEAHRGHLSYAGAIAVSADGDAVVATERGVEVWNDGSNGGPRWIVSRLVVDNSLNAQVSLSPDGRYLVTAEETERYDRNVLRIYDLTAMKLVAESPPIPRVECLAAGVAVVAFSSESGREVQIWKWRERKSAPRRLFQEHAPAALRISPSGNVIAVQNESHGIALRRLGDPEKLLATVPVIGECGFAFSESDDEIVTRDFETLSLFRLVNGRAEIISSTAIADHSDLLATLGGGLVALGEENEVVLRDLRAPNAPIVERLDHGALVTRLVSAPGLIGSVGVDGIFHLWRPHRGARTEEVARIRVGERDAEVSALLIGAGAQVLVTTESQRLEVRPLTAGALLRIACARMAGTASGDPAYDAACAAH
jgi:WD40 repeat protein